MPRPRQLLPLALVLGALSPRGTAQTPLATDPVRVTMSINADGSRTTYKWETGLHQATATTTTGSKLREKIRYQLDDAGRFVTGEVFGPNNVYRFSTRYKYDGAGKMAEEAQLTKEGAVQHRIVYSYDAAGKQIGYAVYDGAGKLVSQTAAPSAKAAR